MTGITPDGTAYDLVGPTGAPVVVLIHGLGLNQACWQWTVPALTDAYQVLIYDLFGHGQSGPPTETPSLSMFSGQLSALMNHCQITSGAIIGFSLGGMIARRFAYDNSKRATALGILHSPHQRSPKAQDAIIKRTVQARTEGPSSTIQAALERWFTTPYRLANPEMMNLIRRWVIANDIAIYHTIYSVLAEGIDEITAPVPPISCPAFVLTGDEDFGNGPEMTRAIADEINGAELHILRGLRHMALAEAPDQVNVPLRHFLDRALKEKGT